ncbi:MAG: MFS transporter [Candidatus Dormibacteria bacterium]
MGGAHGQPTGARRVALAKSTSPGLLIALRTTTGVGAAMIYPVTLSIIVNVFEGRAQRSMAIAIWGASAGAAIGAGPLIGGLLVQHFWWGSILLFTGLIGLIAVIGAVLLVPDSRDPDTPPADGSRRPAHRWRSPSSPCLASLF